MVRLTLSAIFLISVNVVPLVGVAFFGWSLFAIMLLYWFENGIIGFLNVFKIALARKTSGTSAFTFNGRRVSSTNKAFVIPFFIFHYGMFWTVHGVFVIVFFGFMDDLSAGGFGGFDPRGVAIAAALLLVSHLVSFFMNFVREREYLNVSPAEQMSRPYSRVIVLHLTILGGGFLAGYLGAPLASLVLLVVLKTAIDLRAHFKEHRDAAEGQEAPAPGG